MLGQNLKERIFGVISDLGLKAKSRVGMGLNLEEFCGKNLGGFQLGTD